MSTTTTNILDTIRAATEGRDAEALSALYAADAGCRNRRRPLDPAQRAPRAATGHGEIVAYLRDSCSREMTHEVRDTVLGGDRLAFTTHCRYPDGTRVLCLDDRGPRRQRPHRQPDHRAGLGRVVPRRVAGAPAPATARLSG